MSYTTTVLADSPLVYWRLNDASGTTMVDASGNGRDGTYTNSPTLGATGLIADGDKAATFGVNTCGTGPSASWASPSTPSAVVWFNTTTSGTFQEFLSHDDQGSNRLFQFRVNNANKLEFIFWRTTGGGPTTITGTTTISTGTTHMAAFTYDGTTVTMYLDGAVEGTPFTGSADTFPSSTLALRVGCSAGTIGIQEFTGTIDEVSYYGTALSAARISALYQAGITAALIPSTPARRRWFPPRRRQKAANVPPKPAVTTQALPPQPGRAGRHSAPPLPKRRTSRSIPPNQAVTTAPPPAQPGRSGRHNAPPPPKRRATRNVYPTQPVLTAPLPPQNEARRRFVLLPRRRTSTTPVPVQAATPTTQALPPQQATRRRFVPILRRGATQVPPTAPLAPPVVARGRHAAPPVPRRQRGAQALVAAPAAPTTQALPPQGARRLLRLVVPKRQRGTQAVPQAVPAPPVVARGRHQAPPVLRRFRGAQPIATAPVSTTQALPPQPPARRRFLPQFLRRRTVTSVYPAPVVVTTTAGTLAIASATTATLVVATVPASSLTAASPAASGPFVVIVPAATVAVSNPSGPTITPA